MEMENLKTLMSKKVIQPKQPPQVVEARPLTAAEKRERQREKLMVQIQELKRMSQDESSYDVKRSQFASLIGETFNMAYEHILYLESQIEGMTKKTKEIKDFVRDKIDGVEFDGRA